jgi:hypothetical protein
MQYKKKTPANPRCIYLMLISIKPVKDNETLDTIFIIVNIVISNLFIFF